MTKQEDKNFKEVDGIFSFFAYIFRYRMKEFLMLLSLMLFGYIMASNISYSKKDGFQWVPSVKIEVVK